MDIAEVFDADIAVTGPDPNAEGHVFVKRQDDVDHDQFVVGLLEFLATLTASCSTTGPDSQSSACPTTAPSG